MGKDTQEKEILEHLFKFGSISSWDAIRMYGITRLSHYIYALRKKGYPIEHKDICSINAKGRHYHFRVYYLLDEEQGAQNEE